MNPLISIITVCFNEFDNINKTCESVLSQTYRNFEWIVIDGGSTDGTLEVLRSHQSAMSYLVSEKDNGIYNAMNKGILQAKGKYLLFLNGGDHLLKHDTLEEVAKNITADDADIYYGEIQLSNPAINYPALSGAVVDYIFFYKGFTLNHQAMFIKSNLFLKYGLYDETFKLLGDVEWCIRTILKNKVSIQFMDMVVSVFNMDGASQSSKNRETVIKERKRAIAKYWTCFDMLKVYTMLIYGRRHYYLSRILAYKEKSMNKLRRQGK